MARISYAQRKKLPTSAFALPEQRKYHIENEAHGRNAIARARQFASPAQQATIIGKVKRRYPGMEVTAKPGRPTVGKKR